jgi:disulfide bond formation protein DsbB
MNGTAALPTSSRLGLIAFLGSGALLLGALYFQYVMELPPCDLCHWQRYPHIAVVVAGLGALVTYRHPTISLVLLLVAITGLLVTAGIGIYHVGVEYKWWLGPQTCSGNIPTGLSVDQLKKYLFGAKMVRCDETAWSMWGISMAGWNVIFSAGLAFVLGAYLSKSIPRT